MKNLFLILAACFLISCSSTTDRDSFIEICSDGQSEEDMQEAIDYCGCMYDKLADRYGENGWEEVFENHDWNSPESFQWIEECMGLEVEGGDPNN